jgi:predicted transcriptional regulator
MPEEPPSSTLDRELTSTIVAAYVRQNQITSAQLGALISTVHQALSGLGKPAADTEGERTPAVPIRRSVHRDYVVCLECGWRGQMLRRHLTTGHGLSAEQYPDVVPPVPGLPADDLVRRRLRLAGNSYATRRHDRQMRF